MRAPEGVFSLFFLWCIDLEHVTQALQLVSGEFNDEFFAGGDVRIGDIVLLVDSDTRVPEDCLSKSSGMRVSTAIPVEIQTEPEG